MCCRGFVNFIIRCQIAIYEGFIEYCQKSCLIGTKYLVKPNYHFCERLLWFAIFVVCGSIGFTLVLYYMNTYSLNVYRIAVEKPGRHQKFNYPSLGICEMGLRRDDEALIEVEKVLNDSLYKQFPNLRQNDSLKNFIQKLAFQNLNRRGGTDIWNFFKYTQTLETNSKKALQNYNYKELVEKITRNCSNFFIECQWLNEPFKCCTVSTMLGKCFLFHSNQTYNPKSAEMVKRMEIFKEPYAMQISFSRPAKIFILNPKDIPETIAPIPRYELRQKGVTLSLEFTVVPTLTDATLTDLDPQILRCIQSNKNFSQGITFMDDDNLYAYESYSTCITLQLYEEQRKNCGCRNVYVPKSKDVFCNLTQFVCLEEKNLINRRSMLPVNEDLAPNCMPTCEDSEYVVQNAFYSVIDDAINLQNAYTLEFILLNFPTTSKRRQAIRQAEDKMASFSGIVGLFMGLNVVNAIEFIYLTCRAFWKYKATTIAQGVATKRLTRKREANNQIVLQP